MNVLLAAQTPSAEPGSILSEHVLAFAAQLSAQDYDGCAEDLQQGRETDYLTLRMASTRRSQYAPDSERNRLTLLLVNSLVTKQRYADALEEITKLLRYDIANAGAHLLASRLYQMQGDSVKSSLHFRIYSGLLRSALQYGDGTSAATAFVLISREEEDTIIQAAGYSVVDRRMETLPAGVYDLVRVCNPKIDREFTIYFNISLPLRAAAGPDTLH